MTKPRKPKPTRPEQIRAKLEKRLLAALDDPKASAAVMTEARRYFKQSEEQNPFSGVTTARKGPPAPTNEQLLEHLGEGVLSRGYTLPFMPEDPEGSSGAPIAPQSA